MGDLSDSRIKCGVSILIERSDGRTHPATISAVDDSAHNVTVEWIEDGEAKGKEVDFDSVYALNLHLKTNNKTIKSVEENGNEVIKIPVSNSLRKPFPRNTLAYSSGSENKKPSENKLKVPNAGNLLMKRQQTHLANNHRSSSAKMSPTISEPNINNPVKRSSVVVQVEKLQKNREERRIQQAKIREERDTLINQDRGNPNWQFCSMIREFRSGLDIRPLSDSDTVEDHQITVCVRKRPLNKKEINKRELDVITIPRKDTLIVHEPKSKVDLTKYLENQQFRFDYAFDEDCGNEVVYKYTAKPLVQTIFDGGMATCFAYGQTGSGKTHTMGGTFSGKSQDCKKGIYALATIDVFKLIHSPKYRPLNLVVTCSFFEIYSGKVFDLLASKAKLRVLEDSKQQVQVVGLTEKVVNSVDEVLRLIQMGTQARTSGQTSANSNSSRSHAVFQITLHILGSNKIHGKFSLIDLAGNERGADTSSADRLTRMEGAEINKSLLALKECIRALGRKGAHLPFRVSKLTQVLRDSFIGEKSRTCMIAMISPGMSSCEHSLNTLRYADRVKELGPVTDLSTEPDYKKNHDPADYDSDGEGNQSHLAALRSLNEEEISSELLNFHEVVSELNSLEDDMLDEFKAWRSKRAKFESQEKQLMLLTSNVDYDMDSFASRLHAMVADQRAALEQLDLKISAFRKKLIAEEEISRKIHPNRK